MKCIKTKSIVFLVHLAVLTFSIFMGYGLSHAASPSLVINEVLFDPSGADAGSEWVELIAVNDVNVNGYEITDNDGNTYTFPAVNVRRGETIVVHFAAGANDTAGPTYHFYTGADLAWLSNTGDDIEIRDSGGTAQEYIAYGSGGEVDVSPGGLAGWGAGNIDITVVDEGHSIGLNEDADDLDDNSNWEEVITPNPGDPNQATAIAIEKSGAAQIHQGDTAGEEYIITIENTGVGAVFVEEVLDDYPADFTMLSVNSLTLNGGAYAGYTTSDAGGVYTFDNMPNLLPGDQVEIRLQMRAECTAAEGFNNNTALINYLETEGGGTLSTDHTFPTEVIFGILDPIMLATHVNGVPLGTPTANPDARVGDRVTYKVELHNTFDGNLYDVDPEALWGTELSLEAGTLVDSAAMNCTEGATITCDPVTIPADTEDDTYSFTFDLNVNGCLDIDTTIQATDRCNPLESVSSSVYLDLGNPDIDYTISAMDIPYGGTTPVTINVTNSGDGPAWDFRLDTGFEGECVSISNVAAGWTYTIADGVFTYTGGNISAGGGTAALTFDLGTCNDCLNRSPGGTVQFEPYYDNDCDEEFISPKKLDNFSTTGAPTVTIGKTMVTPSGTSLVVLGDTIQYTVTLTVPDKAGITGNIVVTDTIPAGEQTYVGGSLSASEGAAAIAGNVITWTVGTGAADNPDGATMTFSTTIPMDPCLQGTTTENTASYTATDFAGCALSGSDSAGTVYINNNPNNTVVAQKDVSNSGNINVCESAGVTFTNDYVIASGVVGEWDDGTGDASSLTDELAGGAVCYVTGSAQFNFDTDDLDTGETWMGWTPVPAGFITYSNGNPLVIDLGFLSAIDQLIGGEDNVAGNNLQVRYEVYACEGLSGSYDALTTIQIDGNTGSCGAVGEYTQHGLLNVVPVAVSMGIQILDFATSTATEEVESCGDYKVRITVNNPTGDYTDLVVNFPPTNYEYVGNPVYTGFNANIPAVTVGADVEFSFDANAGIADLLTEGGTITFDVRKSCDQTPSDVSATGTYYTPLDPAAACCAGGTCGGTLGNLSATDSPVFEYKGRLEMKATPDPYPVDTKDLQWSLYIYNRGDGRAFNTVVEDVFGPGLQFVSSLVNGVPTVPAITPDTPNPGETTLEWDLGDMDPNDTVEIEITAQMSGDSCTPADSSSAVDVYWGCGVTNCETISAPAIPTFSFLESEASAYNVFPSSINLCQDAEVVFRIKNINKADIYNVMLIQDLESTGMTYIPGSARISTDPAAQGDPGHASWAALADPLDPGADPANPAYGALGAGTTRLFWQGDDNTRTNYVADLSVLASAENILIYFQAQTDCSLPENPEMHVEATYQRYCDYNTNTRQVIIEDQQTIPFRAPELEITKEARNATDLADPTDYSAPWYTTNVYAGSGDTIQYRIRVTNNSAFAVAENVILTDNLPANLSYVSITKVDGEVPGDPAGVSPWTLEEVDTNDTDYYIIEATVTDCEPEVTNTADVTVGCAATGCTFPPALGYDAQDVHGDLITEIDFDSSAIVGATGFDTCGGEVTITVENNGAPSGNVLVTTQDVEAPIDPTQQIPDGWVVDTDPANWSYTFTPAAAPGQTVVADYTDTKKPVWTVSDLDNNQEVSITFFLLPDGTFCDSDLTSDPAPPAGSLTIPIGFTANDSCGNPDSTNDSLTVNPDYIDLDVDITPNNQLIVEGGTATFDITITNNGNMATPNNTANFVLNLGNGFNVTDGAGGVVNNGVDPRTVTWANLGVIPGGGGTWTRTVEATIGAGNLEVQGIVEGVCDSSVFCRYSYDEDDPDVAGVLHSKIITRIDEPGQVVNPSTGRATIGNAVYYEINLRFPGEGTYTNVSILDDTNNRFDILNAETQFNAGAGWVNTGVVSNGIQVDSADAGLDRIFTIHDGGGTGFTIAPGAGAMDILIRVVARVNTNAVIGNNPPNSTRVDFTYDSGDGPVTYDDGDYTGILRDTVRTRIIEPQLTAEKTYPGWPATYNDANPLPVVVGDIIDYTLSFTNTNGANNSPAYDVVVTDEIPFGMRAVAPIILDVFIDTDGDLTNTGVDRTLAGGGVDYTLTLPNAGNLYTLTVALNNGANGDTLNTNVINPGEALVVQYRGEVDSNSGAGLLITNNACADYTSIRGTPVSPEDNEEVYPQVCDYTILSTGDTTITKVSTLDGATVEEADQIIYTLTFPNPVQGVYLYGDDDDNTPTLNPEFWDTIPDGLEVTSVGISITATRACENIYGVTVPPYSGGTGACAVDDRVYTITTSPVGAGTRDRHIEIQFNKMYPGDYLVVTIKAKVHYDFDDGSLIPNEHVFDNQGHIEVYTKPSTEAGRTSNVYDSEIVSSIYHKLISIVPDRSSQTTPGNWVEYKHTVRNQTSSTEFVCFSTASSKGWEWVIFDESGNILTDGATRNSLEVAGDDTEKITMRYFVPTNTPNGTTDGTLVLMHPYDTAGGTCEDSLILDEVTDTTVVLIAQMELSKLVRACDNMNFVACSVPPYADPSVFIEENDVYPCGYLEYRIDFFNSSTQTYYDLSINDEIPNWTDFVPDAYGAAQDILLYQPDGSTVYLDVAGVPSELVLDLSGHIPQVNPGDRGYIRYKVRVKGEACP